MTKNRILATILALALSVSLLSGCSSVPGMGGSSSSNDRSSQSDASTPDSSSSSSSAQPDESTGSSDGPFYVGDTISTAWFDFTIDSVEVASEYEGYAAGEGNKLLVVQLSLKSTYTTSSDMFREDFVVGWDLDDEDFDYVEPLSAYCDAQFPDEYSLGINQSRSGVLVYEVQADLKDFWINFLEYFSDDTYGESYFIYFTAE